MISVIESIKMDLYLFALSHFDGHLRFKPQTFCTAAQN